MMGSLKPLWVRVGTYIVTVNAILQFAILMFNVAPIPKWSILSAFALLALYAGDEAETQWKLARYSRKIRRLQQASYAASRATARNRAEEPVTLIKITRIEEDHDEYPS